MPRWPETLAAWTAAACSRSPLRGRRIVVTAGSIPIGIDEVRVMTHLFRGRLGIRIAEALAQRGADVKLVFGPSAEAVPSWLPMTRVRSLDEYREVVLREASVDRTACHILSAAVADYRVRTKLDGKIPSTGLDRLDLLPRPAGSEVERIAGVGHFILVEAPRQVNGRVLRFLGPA